MGDFDLCPMDCGRTTDDAAGGPCSACWDALDNDEAPVPGDYDYGFAGPRKTPATTPTPELAQSSMSGGDDA